MSALRRIRLDRDEPLTIAQLAELAGVSEDQIGSIENGKTRNPRVDTLRRLAGALGVKPSEIDPVLTGRREAA